MKEEEQGGKLQTKRKLAKGNKHREHTVVDLAEGGGCGICVLADLTEVQRHLKMIDFFIS